MAGGGLGNVDPRQQRNPSTASPFGGSMVTARPEPINYEAPQPGRPYMGVGIQPMPMQPYGMQMPQPYGRPDKPMMPVQTMMHGVEPHSHGPNGEITQTATPMGSGQLDGPYQGPIPMGGGQFEDRRPYQGPMPDLQAQQSAQQAHDSYCQQNPMARGCEGMGSGISAQIGSAVGPQIGSELFKQRYE